MLTYLITLSLVFSIAFLLGTMFASRNDTPVKRTVEQMNADEAIRSNERKVIALRAALIDIRNSLAGQQSGTAVRIYRAASKALGL